MEDMSWSGRQEKERPRHKNTEESGTKKPRAEMSVHLDVDILDLLFHDTQKSLRNIYNFPLSGHYCFGNTLF